MLKSSLGPAIVGLDIAKEGISRDLGTIMTFFSLPLEIRDRIYRLLLIQKFPINIRSPFKRRTATGCRRDKRRPVAPTITNHFGAILQVNKQLHGEATPVFYSANQFAVGIGDYGSSSSSNFHGLKAFLARVPVRYISLIKRVVLTIHLIPEDRHWFPDQARVFAFSGDASDAETISRILITCFTGLQSVLISWIYSGKYSHQPWLSKLETEEVLVKIMRILVKHPTARKLLLTIVDDNVLALPMIVGQVLKQELEACGRVITAEQVPFPQEKRSWTGPEPESQFHLTW